MIVFTPSMAASIQARRPRRKPRRPVRRTSWLKALLRRVGQKSDAAR